MLAMKNTQLYENAKRTAIFVAQFAKDTAPFNSWSSICDWASNLGYIGIQIPSWDTRLIDLEKVASSQAAADELKGVALEYGIEITELSTICKAN